jgi:quinol-cytochrome oxidoreductase complex cytochrome b subunit
LGHSDNYVEANALVTPAHIVPEWYFLPLYAVLRSIPDKLGGVCLMFAAILVLLFVPFLNLSPVRCFHFLPFQQFFFWLLVVDWFILGWIGACAPEPPFFNCWSCCYCLLFFIFFFCTSFCRAF